MTEEIKAFFIYEILGCPPEHIKQAMEEYLKSIGKQKNIIITSKTIHEPKELEEKGSEGLYTTFAEVEMDITGMETLFSIILNTLPSSVEILKPQVFSMNNSELRWILSEITAKLHRYDEVAKSISVEKNILLNKIRELQGEKSLNPVESKDSKSKSCPSSKISKTKKQIGKKK